MGLTIALVNHDFASLPCLNSGLLADLRSDAGAAANNLTDDLANRREGQVVWADIMPGARPS